MLDASRNDWNQKMACTSKALWLGATIVALLAASSQAVEFAGGTGAPAEPYQIATAEQLSSIGDDPNLLEKYFVLVNDIDLDPNLPGGQLFTHAVIAYDEDPYHIPRVIYTGRFFGDGHTIRHLTITATHVQYLGLFGTIGATGRVYDLTLEDVRITGADYSGGLAGINEGGIVNCYVGGCIRGGERSNWLGGLVGINKGTIIDCGAGASVTAGDYSLMLGGLVGMQRGGISNSYATGHISGGYGSLYLGGLVGASVGGRTRDSHAAGHVLGGDAGWAFGGLVGRADSESVIANCYSSSGVTAGAGGHDLGGLVGSCFGVDVSNCYATGAVTGGARSYALGGLLGSCLGTTVSDCYATGEVRGFRTLGGFAGLVQTGTSLAHCHAVGTVLRNDRPWGRGGFAGYVDGQSDVDVTACFWDVDASQSHISAAGTGLTATQMRDIGNFQAAGWDVAGERADGTADLWLVLEGGDYPVLATLSDAYEPHVLEGSGTSFDPYLIATAEDLGAMGRYSSSARYQLVADIDLSGITWTAPPVAAFAGIFDGHAHQIRRLTLRADRSRHVGLFGRVGSDGWVYNLGLEDVLFVLPGGSRIAGGMAGENAGHIVNCYVTATISSGSGGRSVGGLVGVNWLGTISDCYTAASVQAITGSQQIGGLLGYNYLGTLANSYASGRVSSTDGSASHGGLVGAASDHAATYSCYFLTAYDGGGPDRGPGAVVTGTQLKQRGTFIDWNFDETWMLCEGQDYPHLLWEGLTCEE